MGLLAIAEARLKQEKLRTVDSSRLKSKPRTPIPSQKPMSSSSPSKTKPSKRIQISLPQKAKPLPEKVVRTPSPGKNVSRKEVTTLFDDVVAFVASHTKPTFQQTAAHFGVKPDNVEEWAKILEENGIISIEYPPIGKPYLKIK